LAKALLAAGIHVVLCGPGESEAIAGGTRSEVGRLARMVIGPGDDPARVEEEAVAMARELFGATAVVVRDRSDAAQVFAGLPGPGEG
jgi:hypothetical protein